MFTNVIQTLRRLRLEHHEFKAGLGCIGRCCLYRQTIQQITHAAFFSFEFVIIFCDVMVADIGDIIFKFKFNLPGHAKEYPMTIKAILKEFMCLAQQQKFIIFTFQT